MDILSLLYIGGVALSASGIIFFLIKNKTKDSFTIKSDGKVNVEGVESGYKPRTPYFTPNPPKNTQKPPQRNKSEIRVKSSKKIIDMKNISGIRVEGSSSIRINNGIINISENAKVRLTEKTLFVETEKTTVSTSGVFGVSYNNSTNDFIRLDTINLSHSSISRLSVQGNGDIRLRNMKLSRDLSLIVEGSGGINIENATTGTLSLVVKGSGDIYVGSYCQATQTLASIKGSGDINIKSKSVGVVSKKIQGSGVISTPSDKQKNPGSNHNNSYGSYGGGIGFDS